MHTAVATPATGTRINARLDAESHRQLNHLTAHTGGTVSEVVRQAIAAYYAQRMAPRPRPESKFLKHVGKFSSGQSDIASNIKRYVGEVLEAKHGLSPKARRP